MVSGDLDYLLTSLPYLSFQKTEEAKQQVLNLLHQYEGDEDQLVHPLTILNNEAQKFLSSEEFKVFKEINLQTIHNIPLDSGGNSALMNFSQFMFELKSTLSEIRDPQSEKKNVPGELESLLGEGNPLHIEERLISYQWQKLEELAAGHFTDFEALIIYKLQLYLLLRWWSFDGVEGQQKFIQITST